MLAMDRSDGSDVHGRPRSVAAAVRDAGAPVLVQFVKFGIVGVSNTLLTFAVYTVLLKVFGVWYLAASAIGFGVGALVGSTVTINGHPLRYAVFVAPALMAFKRLSAI